MTEKLSSYGPTFQLKIISALLSDIKFFQTIGDILVPDMFDSAANSFLVKVIREYYFEYKVIPTLDVLKVKIDDLEDDVLKVSVVESLKIAWQNLESKDLDFVKDEILVFCKNQVLKSAIIKSVDLLESREYDEIKRLIDDAMRAGTARDVGHNYIEGLIQRLTDSKRRAIETPWDPINEITDGGLSPGELGIVVAPAGIGKCIGGDTKVDIEYEKIGFELSDKLTLWFDPWDVIEIDEELKLQAWQVEILLSETDTGGILRKTVRRQFKVKSLFDNIGVDNTPNAKLKFDYNIKISTPYGYYPLKHAFRTEIQPTVRIYFGNNKTLKCGLTHRLKVNGEWKYVKDIILFDDVIETNTGITFAKKIQPLKNESLYDFSVHKVHCYYSNGILSHNSWMLQMLGSHATRKLSKTVLHYTLELKEAYTGLRFDTIHSNITTSNIKYHKDEVEKVIKTIGGNLIIKYYPTKTASVQTLMSHIKQAELVNINPDMIVVDYADLLKYGGPSARLRTDEILGNIYAELRGLGGEIDCPVWTACFHGNTTISSPIGKFRIKDMVGKSGFPVFSYDHIQGKIVCKTVNSVYKSGKNQELWKVVLDNDKEIIVTPNHKFMLRDGTYEELQNLKAGDSLMPFNRKFKNGRKFIYLNNGSWKSQYRMIREWKFGDIPKYYQIRTRYKKLYNHKIKSIEFYGYDDVYNMEVDNLHNYALDAGIIVKNSQANRASLEEDVIEAGKIASSYEKMMIADFVMSISRRAEDKIANLARCHVIKNRFGPDGITYPMTMNTNVGIIDIYEGNSVLGKEQQSKLDNRQEHLRQQLKNKYDSFKGDDQKLEGFE